MFDFYERLKSFILSIGIMLLLSFFLILKVQAFGFGLMPTRVEVLLQTGSQHREIITIKNVAKKGTVRLSLGLADWTLNTNQKVIFSSPRTKKTCWLITSPCSESLTL